MKPVKTRNHKEIRISDRIMRSVRARDRGVVVTWKDFASFGKPDAIRQALSRLVQRGMLRRVARGIYDWPRTIATLGITAAPNVDAVVAAVARHDGARVVPDGARAANMLGLSTQVPARDSYRSSGSTRHFKLGQRVVQVRRGSAHLMACHNAPGAALVISALAYIGKRDVDADDIAHLRQVLPPHDKTALRHAAPRTFPWMRPLLMKIADN